MTDRIANPWGERTPFGQGEEWPIRVDQFLEEGVSEEEIDRWVQTASILHSNGDALDIAVKDGRIVGVRDRGVDRVNKGRVDPKRDRELLEIVNSCEVETSNQIKWINTRMKQAAPQVLLVAS